MNHPYQFTDIQTHPHPDLLSITAKHSLHHYRRPIQPQTEALFHQLLPQLQSNTVILDSGCGTGLSTTYLAKQFPEALIVGVDKSPHRLRKHPIFRQQALSKNWIQQDNLVLLEADIVAIWQLMARHQLRLCAHYLFYPNPWPKAKHLKRRFYAHPIFPEMMQLSQKLICRSNWLLYLQEWQIVLEQYYLMETRLQPILYTADGITRFEQKYVATGCPIFELTTAIKRP